LKIKVIKDYYIKILAHMISNYILVLFFFPYGTPLLLGYTIPRNDGTYQAQFIQNTKVINEVLRACMVSPNGNHHTEATNISFNIKGIKSAHAQSNGKGHNHTRKGSST
jgi:hypothetical protein